MTAEQDRLQELHKAEQEWLLWGPYLSERSWATIREHYHPTMNFWDSFSHEQSRSRTYRWGEDGLAGISDRHQYLCFALTVWNGQDPILKERLFGLTNPQGNHGEDVKEYYFYLDNTPTHSYMKYLYKYPHAAFPYQKLVDENAQRHLHDPEFELLDTGIFDQSKYFDIQVEYVKGDPNDIFIYLTIHNRGPESAPLHILPTLWFRNTWSWGYPNGPRGDVPGKPSLTALDSQPKFDIIQAQHPQLDTYHLYADKSRQLLFTENETNTGKLYGQNNRNKYSKDAFHRFITKNQATAINPKQTGTKAAAYYKFDHVEPGKEYKIKLRLSPIITHNPFENHLEILHQRRQEADDFYQQTFSSQSQQHQELFRQSASSLLWTKQFYYYDVEQWLAGDPIKPRDHSPTPPAHNQNWQHLKNHTIISMPDKWEYPWYANWDLAFHCLPLAKLDMQFAKHQLELLVKERYMHPNGQLPSYENDFDSVNPPVVPWATWEVYQLEKNTTGPDHDFLERMYHKLIFNFSWWVNRKDLEGHNLFEGGFLGLDNIGVIDRNDPLEQGKLAQADSTSWMASYALVMVKMGLELTQTDPAYKDIAVKFFDHFLRIAEAMTHVGDQGINLWDEQDGFYYDVIHTPDGKSTPLKVRSLVGLLPMIATEIIEPDLLEEFPELQSQLHELLMESPDLVSDGNVASCDIPGKGKRRLLSILNQDRLRRVLTRLFDENEFLAPYGIRSVSKFHADNPFSFQLGGETKWISYEPAESTSRMFGGNSNWRGPVWFPLNYMFVHALRKFHTYYGKDFQMEYPTGSGSQHTLDYIADDISKRLTNLFLPNEKGNRPYNHGYHQFQDPHWKDHLLFYEYFNPDTGKGLGAAHQTGWTALVLNLLLEQSQSSDG